MGVEDTSYESSVVNPLYPNDDYSRHGHRLHKLRMMTIVVMATIEQLALSSPRQRSI